MRFSAVDLPEANDLTVGIMALVAQQEREAISRRTKEALAVAKARGVKLGNPNGAAALRRAGKGGAPLRAAIARNADRHAQDLAPVVADIRACGATSLRAIAGELNARGMLTRRGGRWHVSTVMNLLDRLGLGRRHAPVPPDVACRDARRIELSREPESDLGVDGGEQAVRAHRGPAPQFGTFLLTPDCVRSAFITRKATLSMTNTPELSSSDPLNAGRPAAVEDAHTILLKSGSGLG